MIRKTLPRKGLVLLVMILLQSCGTNSIPDNFTGTWTTTKIEVTVRTNSSLGTFEFTKGSAVMVLNVFSDGTAEGTIGSAEFSDAKVKKNWGNPSTTGVAYTIECGEIGKIFENDPLDQKQVELWVGPIQGTMDAELRYTEGLAHFPMADMVFIKQ